MDAAGNVVWQARSTAFGKAEIQVETVENPLRFPGQYFDAETGLHYNFHRYYDPETGRYTQADPIGLAGGINSYAYVGNNPVNLLDPYGLRIQLMGESAEQKYILKQLLRFVWGRLSIDENGMLSRSPSPYEDKDIESDIDELIASPKSYRIFPYLNPEGHGRAETVPTECGGDIYFDPDVQANYISGFLSVSRITPAAELAHELLGRATQLERNIPHGDYGTETRRLSNERAVKLANRAFKRMGMKKRGRYN